MPFFDSGVLDRNIKFTSASPQLFIVGILLYSSTGIVVNEVDSISAANFVAELILKDFIGNSDKFAYTYKYKFSIHSNFIMNRMT